MTGKRIVVVGAGSHFCVGLNESYIDYARDILPGTTIVLLDINEDHLQVVYDYSCRLASAVDADITFEMTTDRQQAFEGADFILTTFRPGSFEQQEQDESIPPKYGLQGNETVSIGGMFMCCRVVPILREICADAQKLCPDAWIINYTNPTNYVADAVRRISDLKCISLCDSYVKVPLDLAPLLKVKPEDIQIYLGGTNHATWVMRFTVNGEDGYPLLKKRLEQLAWEDVVALYDHPRERKVKFLDDEYEFDEIYEQFVAHYRFDFSLRLYQIYGLLPQPRYYWRYHLDQDALIEEQRSGKYVTMAAFYLKHRVPRLFDGLEARFERTSQNLQTPRREGGGGHGDLAVRVMNAIINNVGEVFAVNVPNQGAISNLPHGAIVDVTGMVDRMGAHPFAMGPLPKEILGHQYSLVLAQELAVDAALSGSRNELLRAILAHPLINSVEAAEKAMDELLTLQKEWLPQFYT
jgi:6-phospho-beta-glucosidase